LARIWARNPNQAPDDELMEYSITPGDASVLGARETAEGVNFALWAPDAERIELCVFDARTLMESQRLDMPAQSDGIWHGCLAGAEAGLVYGYRAHGAWAPEQGSRFNPAKLLIDPWARQLADRFRSHPSHLDLIDRAINPQDNGAWQLKSVVCPDGRNLYQRPAHALNELVIYEAHVKGLSWTHPDLSDSERGGFSGLASDAVLDYLNRLGVNAIQLMPVFAFVDEPFLVERNLSNYWGYNPVCWFAPHPVYGSPDQFRHMVRRLHAAGIEVLLDVVFNHSAESGDEGLHLNLKGLDNRGYYLLDENNQYDYLNYAGCGNTLDAASPIVQRLVLESLRYWHRDMGVDGFRFDLASSLARNREHIDFAHSLVDKIQTDPLLAEAKLIAEPWDLGPNGYQAGQFRTRFSEWNDACRDEMRDFWLQGNRPMSQLAPRLTGSRDRFHAHETGPMASIQYLCAHDGFNLRDLVSYEHKHNLANGEHNRDGHNDNRSINCGVEGSTDDPDIARERQRRMRAMLATLFCSQGVPMLFMGDEAGHSRGGNNNAYCQDNETNWFNWNAIDTDLFEFVATLISLRKANPALRLNNWIDVGDPAITWCKPDGTVMDEQSWHDTDHPRVSLRLEHAPGGNAAVVLINGSEQHCRFRMPDQDYRLVVDSSASEKSLPVRLEAGSDWLVPAGSLQIAIRDEKEISTEALESLGIQRAYEDAMGDFRCAPLASISRIRAATKKTGAMLSPPASDPDPCCFRPDFLDQAGKCRGIALQLYALKSARNLGVGDFEDLRKLAESLAPIGVDFIAINPLHARCLAKPEERSPYAPVSRLAIEPIYIAVDKVAQRYALPIEFPMPAGQENRQSQWVDYAAVADRKHGLLVDLCEQFFQSHQGSGHFQEYQRFVEENSDWLDSYAKFEANHLAARDFAWRKRLNETGLNRYLKWLQWVADAQLEDVQNVCREHGMGIGLCRDLAVGPGINGVEAQAPCFARAIELGAPPDAFASDGQTWGVAALDPGAQELEKHFERLIEVNTRHCGAIRIDHVMGLSRLFWIPQGMKASEGAYVNYPVSLRHMLAAISRARQCIVIGEDLGTLPNDFRSALAGQNVFGLSVAMFEREHHNFRHPGEYRRCSMAAFATHDLPTFRGWWQGADIELRQTLGLADAERLDSDRLERSSDRERLAGMLGVSGNGETPSQETVFAMHRWLAETNAAMVQFQLDDLLGEADPINVPGTVNEYPNWARRYSKFMEDIDWQLFAELFAA